MTTKFAYSAHVWLTAVTLTVMTRLNGAADRQAAADGDRGDVPGWVMITVMTVTT